MKYKYKFRNFLTVALLTGSMLFAGCEAKKITTNNKTATPKSASNSAYRSAYNKGRAAGKAEAKKEYQTNGSNSSNSVSEPINYTSRQNYRAKRAAETRNQANTSRSDNTRATTNMNRRVGVKRAANLANNTRNINRAYGYYNTQREKLNTNPRKFYSAKKSTVGDNAQRLGLAKIAGANINSVTQSGKINTPKNITTTQYTAPKQNISSTNNKENVVINKEAEKENKKAVSNTVLKKTEKKTNKVKKTASVSKKTLKSVAKKDNKEAIAKVLANSKPRPTNMSSVNNNKSPINRTRNIKRSMVANKANINMRPNKKVTAAQIQPQMSMPEVAAAQIQPRMAMPEKANTQVTRPSNAVKIQRYLNKRAANMVLGKNINKSAESNTMRQENKPTVYDTIKRKNPGVFKPIHTTSEKQYAARKVMEAAEMKKNAQTNTIKPMNKISNAAHMSENSDQYVVNNMRQEETQTYDNTNERIEIEANNTENVRSNVAKYGVNGLERGNVRINKVKSTNMSNRERTVKRNNSMSSGTRNRGKRLRRAMNTDKTKMNIERMNMPTKSRNMMNSPRPIKHENMNPRGTQNKNRLLNKQPNNKNNIDKPNTNTESMNMPTKSRNMMNSSRPVKYENMNSGEMQNKNRLLNEQQNNKNNLGNKNTLSQKTNTSSVKEPTGDLSFWKRKKPEEKNEPMPQPTQPPTPQPAPRPVPRQMPQPPAQPDNKPASEVPNPQQRPHPPVESSMPQTGNPVKQVG